MGDAWKMEQKDVKHIILSRVWNHYCEECIASFFVV